MSPTAKSAVVATAIAPIRLSPWAYGWLALVFACHEPRRAPPAGPESPRASATGTTAPTATPVARPTGAVPLEGSDAAFAAATPEVLAEVEWHGDIVVDDTYVYYTSGTAIWRVAVGGGKASRVAERRGARPFAVDDDRLYVTLDFDTIADVPKGGGEPRVVAKLGGRVWRLGMDHDAFYAAAWMAPGSGILSIAKDGGAKRTIVKDGGNVLAGLAVDETHVYWAASAEVRRCRKEGGEVEVVGRGPGYSVDAIALTADSLFWASGATVMMRAKRDGAAVSVGPPGTGGVRGLAVGGGHVYWATSDSITRVDARTGASMATNRRAERRFTPAIVANSRYVFWLSQRDAEFSESVHTRYRLMRLPH